MSFDYSGLNCTGERLIERFGRDVTLRRVTEPTYDFATGTNSGGSEADTTVKAVVTDFKAHELDNEFVRRGDRMVLVSAKSINAPDMNDEIIDNSKNFKIINIETVHTGDTPLLYKMQIRK